MQTEQDIRYRKLELSRDYTNEFVSNGKSIKSMELAAQLQLLDWILEIKYITINEKEVKVIKEFSILEMMQFFDYLTSVDKLNYYEAILEASEDYGGDQTTRLQAWADMEQLKQEFVKSTITN